jgi:hypothetical protein
MELRRHPAFLAWSDSGDLSGIERWQLYDALSCLPDAPLETVRIQKERLTELAERWSDSDALEFLGALGAVIMGGER